MFGTALHANSGRVRFGKPGRVRSLTTVNPLLASASLLSVITRPVVFLHYLEQQRAWISGIHIVHLRSKGEGVIVKVKVSLDVDGSTLSHQNLPGCLVDEFLLDQTKSR
jgi:hypothetical protein